jgi:MraZ protein
VLRGNYAAKIDDKGRLKIPNAFRALVEQTHGSELFVTSLTGESVRIYPMPVWVALEERLSRAPSTHPARGKFLNRVNYFGQAAEIDAQGRVVIHQRLRESAGMAGEVDVLGEVERLEVWNHERLVSKLQAEPFTDDDAKALSEFGI